MDNIIESLDLFTDIVYCSKLVLESPDKISYCQIRNVTMWMVALQASLSYSKYYEPVNNIVDISLEEFKLVFLSCIYKDSVDVIENVPSFLQQDSNFVLNIIHKCPTLIFKLSRQEFEYIILSDPKDFINVVSYTDIAALLEQLIVKCGLYIKFFDHEIFSPEICERVYLYAIENSPMALEYVPKEYRSTYLIRSAVSENPLALKYCLPEEITLDMIKTNINENYIMSDVLPYFSEELVMKILVEKPEYIQYLHQQKIEMQELVVNINPDNLKYCIHNRNNCSIRESALKQDGKLLRYIPEYYRTKKLCTLAYQTSGYNVVEFIPEKWRNLF